MFSGKFKASLANASCSRGEFWGLIKRIITRINLIIYFSNILLPYLFNFQWNIYSSGDVNIDSSQDVKYWLNLSAGEPTDVSCEVFIRSFGSISEKAMVSIDSIISHIILSFVKQ